MAELTDIPVKRLTDLQSLYNQTVADPNADDPYLRGLNNGIRLAHATIFGTEVSYIEHKEKEQPADPTLVSVTHVGRSD